MQTILLKSKSAYLFFFCLALFAPDLLRAGGPISVNSSGEPARWNNSTAVSYHPESGTCALFSNEDMIDKISDNIAVWSAIASINLSFNAVLGEIGSVNSTNYQNYFADGVDDAALDDGINPVIFDDDGKITADIFGSVNKLAVLGFAGPDGFSSDLATIQDGQAVFNCFCLADNPNDADGDCEESGILFTEDDLDFTMVHEFGHMLGLDHTQVNQSIADTVNCDLDTTGDCDDIPAMYPQSVDAGDQITPQRDDEVAILALYGESGWEDSFCVATGVLTDSEGNALRCADVQAETSDTADAIGIVSGALAPAEDDNGDGYTDGEGECLSDCGAFTLHGLDMSRAYTITVKQIDSQWIGGSGINPCASGQLTGVVSEVIGEVVGCTAGQTIDLGTIETQSTSATDSSDSEGDESSAVACGENQDFDACEPVIGCSLSAGKSTPNPYIYIIAIFFFAVFLYTLPIFFPSK